MEISKIKKLSLLSVLAVILGGGLVLSLCCFQVSLTELAVVSRWGEPKTTVSEAGLHFKWPFPIENLWRVDARVQLYSPKNGMLEEVNTKDGQSVTVSNYLLWKIVDPMAFRQQANTIAEFNQQIEPIFRSIRHSVFANFSQSELLGQGSAEILSQIEHQIGSEMALTLKKYGVAVKQVGISQLSVPDSVASAILSRMQKERENQRQRLLAESEAICENIKLKAEEESNRLLREAKAKAELTQAEIEKESSSDLATLATNPQLALFLKKLDAFEKSMDGQTTLILDTKMAPFDLLNGPESAIKSLEKTSKIEKK